MPKLKKINKLTLKEDFKNAGDQRKVPKTLKNVEKIVTEVTAEIMTEEKRRQIRGLKPIDPTSRRRWRLAGSMKVWAKMYLESTDSVRDFRRWAKAKPGEALPWAWKVTYGDGEKSLGRPAGQVNLLVQILSGQSLSPPPPDDNQLLPVLVSQQDDTQSVVLPDTDPGNPENR